MRRSVALIAVVLAFLAGWMLRDCADDRASRSDSISPTPSEPESLQSSRRPRASARDADVPKPPAPRSGRPHAPAQSGSNSTAESAERDPPAAAAETPSAKPLHDVEGLVVDRSTGDPVENVRIHFCATLDGEDLGWEGDRTDAQGKFRCHVLADWPVAKCRFEIVAGRDGYRPARVPVVSSPVRVELEKWRPPPKPGRIVGTARGEDGRPMTGRIFVGASDELDLASFHGWTIADANGRFAIDGLAPGHWRAALAESDERVDVNVSEGQDAPIELTAKFRLPPTGAFAAGELNEASYARERARLELAISSRSRDDGGFDPVIHALQQLEYQWLRYAPGRDVVVTGSPSSDGAYVRLDHSEGAGCQWRAAVAGGTAKFTSIPYGKWRAILVRPGDADIAVDVDVKAGEGPVTVQLPAAKRSGE